MTPRSQEDGYHQHFNGGPTRKLGIMCSFETLALTYQKIRSHNSSVCNKVNTSHHYCVLWNIRKINPQVTLHSKRKLSLVNKLNIVSIIRLFSWRVRGMYLYLHCRYTKPVPFSLYTLADNRHKIQQCTNMWRRIRTAVPGCRAL
jgi:hypothetical protein